MRLTNEMALPQPLFDIIAADDYDRGDADISVTGLLKPARMSALEEEHKDELVEDASDRIWSLYGKLVHKLLQDASRTGIAEQRLFMQCAGWRVSGQTDHLALVMAEGGWLLEDWKFVTVWKAKGETPTEYVQQLNLYAELLRSNGYPVVRARVVALLRDWSKGQARRERDYPQRQVAYLPVPLWPARQAREFMTMRVLAHQAARETLPLCTDEDRWKDDPVWAVMKAGGKRAVKLHNDEQAAKAHADTVKAGFVEFRPSVAKRCQDYCAVADKCEQYQSELKGD